MKYVEDEEGINQFFAAFHMHNRYPVLVVIDDFGEFFDERNCQQRYHSPRGRELAIVRTLALCRNAIDHANETGTCMLLFSDTHHGDTPKFLHIYKRWVNSIYTIKGDGIGSFILKSNGLEMVRTKTAKYSVALQYLVLEEIKLSPRGHRVRIVASFAPISHCVDHIQLVYCIHSLSPGPKLSPKFHTWDQKECNIEMNKSGFGRTQNLVRPNQVQKGTGYARNWTRVWEYRVEPVGIGSNTFGSR
ncbi:hypothetical protein M8C21_014123 [Ambrosia artemisiifolia]|uniref:Uncharacterized protein n=1 Tax=Ambrosia artemisiifolia TaxID=4212 RepID=A0AAD5GAB0_AMBAR|nr:hypothetical protein M8C21_014123 [Ambrosia artemisiifolia]